MEKLFSNNSFVIYAITCIAVITYTNFKENQRMFLLFLFTFGTAFFGIFQIFACLLLLLIITFVFLEYLTEDSAKLEIVIKFRYKILDYLFMMFFQYHVTWWFISVLLLYISRLNTISSAVTIVLKVVSIVCFCIGSHQTISQPFKIKTITEMYKVFEKRPIYTFNYQTVMQEKFDLLCVFEDKTYFDRQKSYSCVSVEYIYCWIKKRCLTSNPFSKSVVLSLHKHRKKRKRISGLLKRGYSTPEMQLLRNIGIVRGYDKYKVTRKIFEVIYAKIFFSSLMQYHRANTYSDLSHFRHYLLYIYFHTVLTRIGAYRCYPFSTAFVDKNNIGKWSMEGLFIACLGLSFRKVSDFTLSLYADVIEKFNLDVDEIRRLNAVFPNERFPLNDNY